jgi:LysR substrate binding domain
VSELAGIPLLLLGRDFQTRVLFDEACQAAHFEPSVRLESRSPQSLIALAEAGHGIAIVPSVVRLETSRAGVAGMLDGARPLGSWSHAVWDSRRYLPTYARGFIKVLEQYAKTSYPGHQWAISPVPCHDRRRREVPPLAFGTEIQIPSSLMRHGRIQRRCFEELYLLSGVTSGGRLGA